MKKPSSIESLGSLQSVSDRLLRDNIRRIVTGFRASCGGEAPKASNAAPGFPSAGSCEPLDTRSTSARSSSKGRQSSETLRRRNSSVRHQQQQGKSRLPSLRVIYSSSSLGRPVGSPVPARKKAFLRAQRALYFLPTLAAGAACIALAILALCLLLGLWLPGQDSGIADSLASRRLLIQDNASSPAGAAHQTSRLLRQSGATDLYATSGGGARDHHREHHSRWGQHMATHAARSLAEAGGASAGAISSEVVAEAPATSELTPTGTGMIRPPTETTAGSSVATQQFSGAAATGSQSADGATAVAGSLSTGPPAAAARTGSGARLIAGVGGGSSGAIVLLQQQSQPQGGPADAAASTAQAGGAANVLQYSGGYANVTAAAFRVVPHTQTWEQCAQQCSAAAACVAWTRVAGLPTTEVHERFASRPQQQELRGGRADVQSCYLKNSLREFAVQRGAAVQGSFVGQEQAVQYVPAKDAILESGTRDPDALPSALYGCPYPPSKQADGGCRPPPACNCYGGICYGEC